MAKVRDILDRKGSDVVSVTTDDSVADAARLMNERGIGGVVVTEGGQMTGIFTERDILRRVVAAQRDPATTPVSEVMTHPVVTCDPDTPLDECSAMMTERRIRHVPVLVRGDLCGLITSGDVLAFQVREHEDTIQYLNSYIYDVR